MQTVTVTLDIPMYPASPGKYQGAISRAITVATARGDLVAANALALMMQQLTAHPTAPTFRSLPGSTR